MTSLIERQHMTSAQHNLIKEYGLSFETEINGIKYYTAEKLDGYYFIDDTDQCGVFDNKEQFYRWANMRECLNVVAEKL